MGDEAAFLRAIAADPQGDTVRLVYADWLEERGDPRFELVRVCQAMRAVPVYSDEYWRLKTRRNELLPQFDLDWLEATGTDGSRYDPVFRDGVPDDVRGRWRLIREFTERWHGIDVPDVGGRAKEVGEVEARLGLALPESVREFVAFAHDAGCYGTLAGGLNGSTPMRTTGLELELFSTSVGVSLLGHNDETVLGIMARYLREADPPPHRFFCEWQWGDDPLVEPTYAPSARPPILEQTALSLCILRHILADLGTAGEPFDNADEARLSALGRGFAHHARFMGAGIYEANETVALVGEAEHSMGLRRATIYLRRPSQVDVALPEVFGLGDREQWSALPGSPVSSRGWVSPIRRRNPVQPR